MEPELPELSVKHALCAGAETITTFIDSLTLEQYYRICILNLRQDRRFELSASTALNLGAVFHCPGDPFEDSVEIAFLSSTEAPYLDDWTTLEGGTGEVMPNGWTRFQSGDVFNNTLSILLYLYPRSNREAWLSQANHIFRCLNITSNFEDYVLVNDIYFNLNISRTTGDPPEGFLFLCPREDFRTGSSSLCWPACTAYWSLDPSGTDRLSPDDATRLGFPSFKLTTTAAGIYWDSSVYEGLRQFHQAKGFDPYSQDVARHLGYPFFRLSSERDALPWAYVVPDDEDFNAGIDSDCDSAHIDDYESEYGPNSACDDSGTPNPASFIFFESQTNPDVDAESSHSEADFHDPAGENRSPEPTEISNYANHNASGSTLEEDTAAEEIFVPSPAFRIVLYIQLTLILFLALSGVHHHVW
ncbi:hypothetical protein MSAN_00121800 [Mycena sanguinolenta]|uniref:Uncharacterized protein n=1 Tax=Mycena sanguinolenta TaxID=230812 RepID=A0A8H7DKS3_9AGAR|nr:hypothetical protein MSAN_00121800 [Mycena sanguinolenta]